MIATRQMIGVPASIADWLGGGAERFWEAADGCLSDWLTQATKYSTSSSAISELFPADGTIWFR